VAPEKTDAAGLIARALLVSLILIAATVIVYAPVGQHGFVNLDDAQYVSANPAVSGGLSARGAAWAFTTWHAGNWHPVTWLSHMLDVQLYGLNAGPHHVTSLLLHIANTVLLFGLLHRMTGALFRSAFVAALFALHPLHVESVAWVAERKDVLSTFFFLLTLGTYLAYVRRPGPSRYAAMLALFALGLMAKPMLVTLPFVLLLLDFWPLGRGLWRRQILEKLPLLALAAASSIVTFVVQQRAGAVKGLDALPLDRRLANAVVTYAAYIGKMLWPAHLAAIYPYPAWPAGWLVAGAIVGLIAVTVLTMRAARRHPYLPVGWLWYLGTLVPVIGLVQVGSQPMADRYTYIPLVGLFVIIAWGISDLLARWPHRRVALGVVAGLLIVGCAIAARRQVHHWRSSVALWEHAVAATAGNYRAEANLGHALAKQGRAVEAIPHYVEALRLKPDDAEAHNGLGRALAEEGRASEAIAHYSEAVRVLPDYVEARNNLGVALMGAGRNDEAARHFEEAVRIEPALAASHSNLGVALAKQGRLEAAIGHFSEALRIDPGYADARKNLAVAHHVQGADLADQGKLDEAIGELLDALRLAPDSADLHYDMAVLLTRKGRTAEAVRHVETALRLDPAHEAARRALDALTRPAR
jgi:Flp pilus assembly protein TadD